MGRMKLWALRGGGSPVQVDMPGGGAHLSIWTAWRGELAYPSGDAWQGELTYPSGDAGVGESSPIHLAMPEWGLTYPAGDAYWRVGSSLVQLEMLGGGKLINIAGEAWGWGTTSLAQMEIPGGGAHLFS